mmetsp:Transcript_52652/g.114871  ORF Transcript_52652/g.114871 Transcript_52652/m.114871 type:complete len:100 (+) Transcript_52652:173-472(+)|eukprot:6177454-Pleurochrysis_carterae.AAC.2
MSSKKPEIQVIKMSLAEAEALHAISAWPTWGCDISEFEWEYTETEEAYILQGSVLVTPTGHWASCRPIRIVAGDFAVFPDGMTCTWEVSEPIEKHYRFV